MPNIYDEAKVITHEEVRKILNTTEMGESPTRLLERKLKIHDYITQQELKEQRAKKVEELLGLYKELSIVRFYLFNENDSDLGQELMNKDDELNKKIKQLEEKPK